MLFCRHEWEVVEKVIIESPIEIAKNNGLKIKEVSGIHPKDLFKKTVLIIVACSKCGKIKKFSGSNYE